MKKIKTTTLRNVIEKAINNVIAERSCCAVPELEEIGFILNRPKNISSSSLWEVEDNYKEIINTYIVKLNEHICSRYRSYEDEDFSGEI